jgi:hypothetical protein
MVAAMHDKHQQQNRSDRRRTATIWKRRSRDEDPVRRRQRGQHLSGQDWLKMIAGFDITAAKDGAEGVGLAATDPPDLILMDLNLPVMSG